MTRLGQVAVIALAAVACLERGSGTREHDQIAPHPQKVPPSDSAELRSARAELADPPGSPDPAAVIRIRLEAEPAHLNPLLAGDALATRVALGDIYEGLLCQSRALEPPAPCLAERFEVSDRGKRWRFWLRRGARFHDGRDLSAADVRFSLELAARSAAPTLLRADFDDLVSIAVDGTLIDVRFAGHRLDRAGAFARLPILPRHLFGDADPATLAVHRASRAPVGTGPLRFVRWVPGESIVLERAPGRRSVGAAHAARIVYKIVPSRERAYVMLGNGQLDLAPQLPLAEARDRTAGGLRLYAYAQPAYLAAVYNARSTGLRDAGHRRALTMLLDRTSVTRAIFRTARPPISGPYAGDEADDAVAPLPFDRQAARAALGDGVRLEILYPAESRGMARVADIWAEDARGIAALIPRPLPFATVLERARAGEFDIALLAFTGGPDLDMYHRLHSSQIGAENYGAIRDPALDRALEAVRAEPDRGRRAALARAAHRAIDRAQPYGFIAADVRGVLFRAPLGGVARGDGLAARFLWRPR